MNVAVIGSRTFDDFNLMENILNYYDITQIISGGARGADNLAYVYANLTDIPIKIIRPDWKKYGKSAGFIRNADIVKSAELVIAFWDGKSRGTLSSIKLCFKNSIVVKIIKFGDDNVDIQELF